MRIVDRDIKLKHKNPLYGDIQYYVSRKVHKGKSAFRSRCTNLVKSLQLQHADLIDQNDFRGMVSRHH